MTGDKSGNVSVFVHEVVHHGNTLATFVRMSAGTGQLNSMASISVPISFKREKAISKKPAELTAQKVTTGPAREICCCPICVRDRSPPINTF